ncbi:MAG: Gfo/Idh/MocA family protein [Leptolyngbyaceae cyanobacterium]
MPVGFDLKQQRSLRFGLVGPGFVGRVRAEAIAADPRGEMVAVAGHRVESATAFAAQHGIPSVCPDWETLIQRSDIDGVIVCNINCDHDQVVRAALEANKAVIVEYPLSLSVVAASQLITLARGREQFLHIEHIELFGGLHQALLANLSAIGLPHYVRYCTAVPQRPAPQKWTYRRDAFGFPLAGALSRLHRLTNLFGAVDWVACQIEYVNTLTKDDDCFANCRCLAQLRFCSGVMAEVVYAKGETTWQPQRSMVVEGDRGALVFEGDQGQLLSAEGNKPITVGSRRGLFAKDTAAVLDALCDGKPLYVTPEESLYALQVAAAAEVSARTGQTVPVTAPYPGATTRPAA